MTFKKASRRIGKHISKRIALHSIFAFICTFLLCLALVSVIIFNRSRVENLVMEQLILEKSIKINDVIYKLLYKTQVLSSIIAHSDGEIESLNQVAPSIIDDPSIQNILIAPGGVVSDVYPLEGNESVLGLDFFSEGAGNAEAVQARDTGQLVLGGPFMTVQGVSVIVGRLPVYINGPGDNPLFWGLVSVTLKYPQALNGAGLGELQLQGFAYEMWRINPDDGKKQIISGSGHKYNAKTHYVERHIRILNADWYLRILPVRSWYEFPETWISILIGMGISILIGIVTQNNSDLKSLKDKMEVLSNTDMLTGIHNRRFFMESAKQYEAETLQQGKESFVILFDLDFFKLINDKYGHGAGDEVLKEVAARTTGALRVSSLFARYGGEEFIIYISDVDKVSALNIANRVRRCISEAPIVTDGLRINLTVSIGIAPATPVNGLITAIDLADKALYRAKESGRDRVMFYE